MSNTPVNRPLTIPLSYEDRLAAAFEEARLTYERCDKSISDDALLDIADRWTTDVRGEGYTFDANQSDYNKLTDDLFRSVFEEPEQR